jgi:hypothetical protein
VKAVGVVALPPFPQVGWEGRKELFFKGYLYQRYTTLLVSKQIMTAPLVDPLLLLSNCFRVTHRNTEQSTEHRIVSPPPPLPQGQTLPLHTFSSVSAAKAASLSLRLLRGLGMVQGVRLGT